MTLNNEQFKNGLDQIGSLLRNNKTQDVTDKAKGALLDIFLDSEVKLDTPEEIEKIFKHIQTLLESKKNHARRDDMKIKRKKMGEFITTTKQQYDISPKKDIKKLLGSLKESYTTNIGTIPTQQTTIIQPIIRNDNNIIKNNNNIIEISKKQNKIKGYNSPLDIEDIEYETIDDDTNNLNVILLQTKFLRELIELEDKVNKVTTQEEIEKTKGEYQQLRANRNDLDSTTKESIKIPKTDTEHALKKINDRIVDKLYTTQKNTEQKLLPAGPEVKLLTAGNKITENKEKITDTTTQELVDLFTVDAHFMDKKNLILESERNRIKDLSEKKYREANWIKKIGIFAYDRKSQVNQVERSITNKTNTNNFIEQDSTQGRIDGNIGTYAQQNTMGLDHNINNRTKPFQNEQVNNIAHRYLMGTEDKTHTIMELNYLFKNEPSLQDIKMGEMTGTDIMAQIDSVEREKYKLHNNLGNISNNTSKIKINLIGLEKTQDSEELEGVRYDDFEGKRDEKLAKALHRGSLGSIAAKVGTGIALSTVLAPLGVVAGVTALGISLQRAKSRRDAIKEIAKTHEDAINLGLGEIESRITQVENNINKATRRQKTIQHFGMGSLHTAQRQKKILDSFKSMNEDGLLIPAQTLTASLQQTQQNNTGPMARVLARIDAGHLRKTQFISTTQGGRNQTAIERNQLMKALKETAIKTPLSSQGNPITVSSTSDDTAWKLYRKTLQQDISYQTTMETLYQGYDSVEKNIRANKSNIAKNSAGNYLKTALAMTAGGTIVGGIAGFHNTPGGVESTNSTPQIIQPHEHSGYELGKFDDAYGNHTSGLDQVQNGQTISIQGESAVDGIKSHSLNNFNDFKDHIIQTQKLITTSDLNTATKDALHDAISENKIQEIMKQASDAGADSGNQRLVVERWREGMENITEHLIKNNMNDVTIKDITFDQNTIKDMIIQKSGTGSNITNRGFEAIVNILDSNSDTGSSSIGWSMPSIFKHVRVPYALPYSNTYAYTNTKDIETKIEEKTPTGDNNTSRAKKPRDSMYT